MASYEALYGGTWSAYSSVGTLCATMKPPCKWLCMGVRFKEILQEMKNGAHLLFCLQQKCIEKLAIKWRICGADTFIM